MPMPSRSQYVTGGDFLSALNAWMATEKLARVRLQEMFDATPEFAERPLWVDSGVDCINVSMESRPNDVDCDVALQALVGRALHKDCEIARVCHGMTDGRWAVFAEVRPL